MSVFIRKMAVTVLIVSSLLFCIILCGCSTADVIEPGKYVCETPHITYTLDKDGKQQKDEIEVNQKVYSAIHTTGYDSIITYYSYQEEDVIGEAVYLGDNEIYAEFIYSFDSNRHQLILKDTTTANVYHLERVD